MNMIIKSIVIYFFVVASAIFNTLESKDVLEQPIILISNDTLLVNFEWESVDLTDTTHTSNNNNNITDNEKVTLSTKISPVENGKEVFLHYIQHFLSEVEANQLILMCDSRNGWRKSPIRAELNTISSSGDIILDKNLQNEIVQKRTSSSCPLLWPTIYKNLEHDRMAYGNISTAVYDEFTIANKISKRAAKLLQVNESQVEPLQIVRYEYGEYYQVHHDHGGYYGFPTEQRPYTILLFLNNVPETDGGGHTTFPLLHTKILPRIGDAILWSNIDFNNNTVLKPAIHEAARINKPNTVKYVCNLWINDYPETIGSSNNFITK